MFSLHANTHISAHRRDQMERLIRYTARGAVSLERLERDANGRVFAIDMARCPVCQQSTLRIIAAMTERSVIRKILRHVKLAVDPPAIVPARHTAFAWAASSP